MDSSARQNFSVRNKIFNGKIGYYDDLLTQTFVVSDRYFIFNSISAGQKGIFAVDTVTN